MCFSYLYRSSYSSLHYLFSYLFLYLFFIFFIFSFFYFFLSSHSAFPSVFSPYIAISFISSTTSIHPLWFLSPLPTFSSSVSPQLSAIPLPHISLITLSPFYLPVCQYNLLTIQCLLHKPHSTCSPEYRPNHMNKVKVWKLINQVTWIWLNMCSGASP